MTAPAPLTRLLPLALAMLVALPAALALPVPAPDPCVPGQGACGAVPGFVEETGDTMRGDLDFMNHTAIFGGVRLGWLDNVTGLAFGGAAVCTTASEAAGCGANTVASGPGVLGWVENRTLHLGVDFAAVQPRLAGGCAEGQLVRGVTHEDTWDCVAIAAGDGVVIRNVSGALAVGLASCGGGEVLRTELGDTGTHEWRCAPPVEVAPDGGIAWDLDDAGQLRLQACAANQVLQMSTDGGGWTCHAGVSEVLAGKNIQVGRQQPDQATVVSLAPSLKFGPGAVATAFGADQAPLPVAGEVVAIDPASPDKVRRAQAGVNDKLVLGVVDGNARIAFGEGPVLVASSGKVQVLVKALPGNPIKAGDLLVPSAQGGIATKCAAPDGCPGRVLGKSFMDYTDDLAAGPVWAMLTLG